MTNFFLTCKECILESPTNFYGCFYLGPFNSSQSLTVANGLRRTLLSEIPGLGIESIEIEGVEHEFCTFPGIRESILDLLLNIKEIVLKYNNNEQKKTFSEFSPNKEEFYQIPKSDLNSNKKPLYGYLQARGPGIIRASDLKLPASVISVDPNQYIATLTTDGFLNIRFTICEGFTKMQNSTVKYNQINKNLVEKEFSWLFESETFKKNESLSNKNLEKNILDLHSVHIGSAEAKTSKIDKNNKIFKNTKTLWLDPVFTPIIKVNYIIESYGSLELNPSNQVILLELWTNGSIHPRDAVYSALSQLNLIFSKLEQMKILNNIFAKSILKDNKFYSKIIKKVKYDYSFYKSNNLKKLKKNLFGISGYSQSTFLESSIPNSLLYFSQNRAKLQKDVKDANEFPIIEKKISSFSNSNNEIKNNPELNILKANVFKENCTIDSLDLPFRIKNSLKNANIINIENLLNYQIEDLKKIPGIGNQSLILLIKKLNEKGLKLNR
uniref:DNA-directed RNA polymerase n=1 Tax=Pseudopediastrum integrum TaxID=271402 RepID=A0A2U8GJF9_9CHLO|nr:alpha subunit of RNA polymerase [Pseudopediastrum integrum]AWI68786.1 alpha subunit of RNA polymerase [Pseudopediastrum integrum]